jgi:hypothetical protein
MEIKGLKGVIDTSGSNTSNHEWIKIVNKYLPGGDIMECQDELIDAGLSEYAKL